MHKLLVCEGTSTNIICFNATAKEYRDSKVIDFEI